MKKLVKIFLVACFSFFFSFFSALAKGNQDITIYLFHGNGCPHCADEISFLETLDDKYDNIKIVKYEVWYNDENSLFMKQVKDAFQIKKNGVPLTIIGNTSLIGYSDSSNHKIERAIEYYQDHDYVDVIQKLRDGTLDEDDKDKILEDGFLKEELQTDYESTISLPFFGKVNLKNLSLFSSAVLIGLIDGFNPCAMWVLLFLIGVLIGMKDRKKMWILGSTFLVTSALVYMVIMFSWIQIVVQVSTSIWIRNLIAVVAVVGGLLNLRSFVRTKEAGCQVVNDTKRKKIFSKIKQFTSEKSVWLALIGIIGLAVSVNLIELACSAGLPLVFTQLLALNHVEGLGAFYYTMIYILFFLLDDFIVFFIAMCSLKLTGISTKYNKYSHLVGGILMVIVGVLLLFKPEWLMFQFR